MKFFSSKRRVVVAAFILLALFTIRPGASRLKARVIHSISAGVGRPVDIGSVHIRLLPRPGFDLQNLVVYDDPAFGAEPILRANEVTADLRLLSLFRGRLEISRLDLTEPSLNFVHRETGHWNLEALLERTARIPLAPTAKAKSEPRPGFPYIEGTSGRINFKNGPEKKPYALTNADFSLWQDSENTWGVRLKAQPFRTDMNLNDTGLLQVSGSWQRAPALRDTPLQLSIEWSRAQLGQLTKLITGNDQGWRGDILLDATLKGTPAQLQITAKAALGDFRRYDITSDKALRMAATCDAEYSSETHEFRQLMCNAPVGDGAITLTGDLGIAERPRYSLAMTAEKVPAAALVMMAETVKKNLPEDLAAEGSLQGNLSLQNDEASGHVAQWKGRGEISDFHLSSAAENAEIGPETVPFMISNDSAATRDVASNVSTGIARRKQPLRMGKTAKPAVLGARVDIGPLAIGGAPTGATLRGFMERTGYDFAVSGEMEMPKSLRLARMAGLPALSSSAEGTAQVDLRIAGNWIVPGNGFAVPQVTGTAKLRNVHFAVRNSGLPVEIVSAEVQLLPNAVHILKLNAKAAGALWMGSLELPRGCGTPDACPLRFALNTNAVALSGVNSWMNAGRKKRPWYQVLALGAEARPAWLTGLRASGRLTADRFQVHGVEATHLSTNLTVENGRLQFSALNAEVLSGKHRGEWKVDLSKSPAVCTGSGSLNGISLAAVSSAMNDGWVAGSATGDYELKGSCLDFWESAEGKLQAEVQGGIFPHVLIGAGTEPLQAGLMKGQLQLHRGEIEIADTELISVDGMYQLTGTASLDREVNLKLTRTSNGTTTAGYRIDGTLEEPRVTALSGSEQARLKALSTK